MLKLNWTAGISRRFNPFKICLLISKEYGWLKHYAGCQERTSRLPKCPDKKINPAKSINTNFVDLKQRFSLLSGESTIFDKGSFLS